METNKPLPIQKEFNRMSRLIPVLRTVIDNDYTIYLTYINGKKAHRFSEDVPDRMKFKIDLQDMCPYNWEGGHCVSFSAYTRDAFIYVMELVGQFTDKKSDITWNPKNLSDWHKFKKTSFVVWKLS